MENNKVVIVHGVQPGDDLSAVEGPRQMADALKKYVKDRKTFSTAFPAYEHLNDEAQSSLKNINDMTLSRIKNPVGDIFDTLVDVVGDVFVYRNSSVGNDIRNLVRNVIEDNSNCILIGHSLGSVVCYDILSDMIEGGLFRNKKKNDWPVRSLITFGSPLALSMFKKYRYLVPHGAQAIFHWYNYSDRNDPVISGKVFGNIFIQNNLLRDTYEHPSVKIHIHDRQVETGFHLLAHINYWQQKHIIMRIADQLK